MTTIHSQPEVVRGYRNSRTSPAQPRPDGAGRPPTAWQQRIPGPQLPGFVTGVTLVAGIWLLLAPSVWNYGNTGGGFDARWNDLLVGLVVAAVGLARLTGRIRLAAATVTALACGLWLIVAPFVLAYGLASDSTRATLNDVLLGLLIVTVTGLGHASARATVATRI